MMPTHPFSPLSVIKVYNVLYERNPEVLVNVSVDRIGHLLSVNFAGFLSRVGDRYSMQNEICRYLPQEMAVSQIAKGQDLQLPPTLEAIQNPTASVYEARHRLLHFLTVMYIHGFSQAARYVESLY
jgi:hypothetical protein